MQLKDIEELWKIDSIIDKSQLDNETLNIPVLHSKYYKIYIQERLVLRKLEIDMKVLKFNKFEFYTEGPNEETRNNGWKMPARGKILKNDSTPYIETDPDIIKLSLKIGIYQEKIEFLESILKLVNNRSFQIKNSIEFMRFQNGLN